MNLTLLWFQTKLRCSLQDNGTLSHMNVIRRDFVQVLFYADDNTLKEMTFYLHTSIAAFFYVPLYSKVTQSNMHIYCMFCYLGANWAKVENGNIGLFWFVTIQLTTNFQSTTSLREMHFRSEFLFLWSISSLLSGPRGYSQKGLDLMEIFLQLFPPASSQGPLLESHLSPFAQSHGIYSSVLLFVQMKTGPSGIWKLFPEDKSELSGSNFFF